jgi:DNA repair exonuclease SbcCD nuclease subunit
MKPLRILHTGDVHLGTSSGAFGERAAAHRAQLEQTFARMVEAALEEQCDLLLVSGDLFDGARPGRRLVRVVAEQLARLAESTPPTYVCLLPGTHDCFGGGTAYADGGVWAQLGHVRVFTPEVSRFDFPDVGVSVYGRACRCEQPMSDPLADIAPATQMRLHIAMAHGWVGGAPPGGAESAVIPAGGIEGSGMHYVALGHQHAFMDCSEGTTRAFYCGAPEPVAIDETEGGSVALVEISPEGDVRVTRKRVGSLQVRALSLDVGSYPSREALMEAIAGQADAKLILDLSLTGVAMPDVLVDASQIADELSERFFRLRVRDGSHVAIAQVRLQDYPEELVVGKFVRKMLRRIEAAQCDGDEEQAALAERALRVGLAFLSGERGD